MRARDQIHPNSCRRSALRAFTLVELLVVMGIIAVLIGVLLPTLGRARGAANRVACLSNVKQLYNGILMYCNDNHGWFPTCGYASNTSYMQYPDDWIWWQANRKLDDSAVAKYVGKGESLKRLLRCPAENFDGRKTAPGIDKGQGPYLYSYALNETVGLNDRSAFTRRTKITQWRAPWKKILLTELLDKESYFPVWGYAAPLTQRHGKGISRGNAYLSPGQPKGMNVSTAFIDGHAESIDDDVACNVIQQRPGAE
jgi:prepilin-type N-terminal cleavage/methylation domain-containing protein